MKKLYVLLALTCLACTAFAQNAVIKIKVVDEQNLLLPGANVTLEDKRFTAATGNNGYAVLTNVPEGKHTLTITYIGFKEYKYELTASGSTIELTAKLQSGVESLNNVLVLGDRLKGQAKALNQQKNGDNITNIISADQIGRFPDANIGDAIKRVPGITMQNDQGEARNIVIRGMGPEFNSVTFNGERIPSAEGDNRRIQMDLIPSDMVQTVEVNKTLTADMDADAIGGSVNLVSRAAPNGLRLSGTLAGGFNPVRDNGFIGTANFVVGNRLANDKFGFVVSGSYNRNVFGSDNVESVWSKDADGKLFVSDHDVRVYDEMRIRRSLAATFDFKLHPLHTITLTGSYNWRDDKENRFRLRHRYRGDAEDPDQAELIYDGNGNITGYTNGEVLRQTKGGLDDNRNESRRLEDQRVRSLALKGEHFFGKLRTDWSVQYAKASEKRPHERYFAMGRRNITISQDITDQEFPLLTDETPLSGYTRLSELTEQFQDQYERDLNAKLNFELPLSIINNRKGAFRFGGRLRSKKKVRDNTFFSYEPVNGFGDITQVPLVNKTSSDFYPGSKYVAGDFIFAKYLGGLDFKNSSLFEETDEPAEYLAGNYNAKETITAGYAELKQDFTDRFSARVGLRVERTDINYTGNIVEDEEDLKGTADLKNNYTDVLPSINLRYKLADNFVIKAAWTNSLARPKYYDLVPYFNINPNDLVLGAGNPKLEPVRSSNLDLMAEKYFRSVGLISGGVFYKKIDRFFYSYIDNNYTQDEFAADFPGVNNPIGAGENWEFSQRRNGDGADVLGFEVSVQRQLDFLPGFWKGFGVYLNYTYTHSKASGIYDASGKLVRNDVKLPGAAPNMFNASLGYESKKLAVRLSGNYTSSYVDDSDDGGYNENSFFDRYYDKQFFLDANASYAITPKWRVFAEANNLTNQPLRYYQGVKERTAQVEYYGPKLNLGVKFDLVK
ncbi:TonB-dependent receptor [Flavihumibacter solisilvae]|uniref:TonB-dependent receptor n=1 Tax=Flavihumibacter solisilvae TaxID=1349421 RepID=A0A0C1LH27_9BACT|nr:TonB-dependent receptor [Flavihumibacter solisilvae]KIC94618.1 TonB-dependent receptor [Flavihumibacter solisilvae]